MPRDSKEGVTRPELYLFKSTSEYQIRIYESMLPLAAYQQESLPAVNA
ncbi:MAG: hypothetical protein JRN67_13585 [Nitrososphaerota archaeon]|nr:hypothetical protein [Nitrososphaerota archaeon]